MRVSRKGGSVDNRVSIRFRTLKDFQSRLDKLDVLHNDKTYLHFRGFVNATTKYGFRCEHAGGRRYEGGGDVLTERVDRESEREKKRERKSDDNDNENESARE